MLGLTHKTKIYQASTSELYGKVEEIPQRETTPFHPYSPYAIAKQYGFWMIKEYREAYGMFAVNGILFNHESERRGETFVTRKITLAAAQIANAEFSLCGQMPDAIADQLQKAIDLTELGLPFVTHATVLVADVQELEKRLAPRKNIIFLAVVALNSGTRSIVLCKCASELVTAH